jgi:alpha-1,2-mannosyltransferase
VKPVHQRGRRPGHPTARRVRSAGALRRCALSIAALGLGLLVARHRLARPLGALTSVAVSGLLVAPISWTHHYVWVVLAMFVLERDSPWWWTGATSVNFFSRPCGVWPVDLARSWGPPPEPWVSAAWVLWALALLASWALGSRPRRQAIVPTHAGEEGALPAPRV